MYVHNEEWDSAQRVANNHDPDSINDVLIAQARVTFERKVGINITKDRSF